MTILEKLYLMKAMKEKNDKAIEDMKRRDNDGKNCA